MTKYSDNKTSLSDAFAMLKNSIKNDIKCNAIGQVERFNSDSTIDVQPVISVKLRPDKKDKIQYLKLPLLKNIPVQFLGGGGYFCTFSISAGDYCLLSFTDNDITNWKLNGSLQDAKTSRKHDLNDVVAYCTVKPASEKISYISDGIAIANNDGSIKVEVNATNAIVKYNDTEIILNGSSIIEKIGGSTIKTATASKVTFTVPIESPQVRTQGLVGTASGSSASMSGTFNGGNLNPDNITQGGKSINSSHTHSNGNDGAPTGGVI